MSSPRRHLWPEVLCRRCWHWFDPENRRGPIPRWCSFACRQSAYRARLRGHRAPETAGVVTP